MLKAYAREYFKLDENSVDLYSHMLTLAESKSATRKLSYMTQYVEMGEATDEIFPSIVHLDATARLQLYERSSECDVLHLILDKMPHKILINTSMNVRGEPIVNNSEQSINCFLNAKLSFLILQNIVLFRDDQNPLVLINYEQNNFELD